MNIHHSEIIIHNLFIDSPVHRLPAPLKAGSGLCMVAIAVLSPITPVYPFLIVAAALLLAIFLSKIPFGYFLKRILLIEPFVAVIAMLALLGPGGITRFSSILAKSTLSLMTVILLSNTTTLSELLSLLRRIHIPPALITIFALMFRYIFVLIDEGERIARARKSRTFIVSRSRAWHARSTMIGQLFLRSTERAERIFAAMSSRGWR